MPGKLAAIIIRQAFFPQENRMGLRFSAAAELGLAVKNRRHDLDDPRNFHKSWRTAIESEQTPKNQRLFARKLCNEDPKKGFRCHK